MRDTREEDLEAPDLLELLDRLAAELGAPSEADVAWARRVTHVEE